MQNLRISQLPVASELSTEDIISVVQNQEGKMTTRQTSLEQLSVTVLSSGSSLNYKGTWNASTDTPTIPEASVDNKGWYYVVNVAGVQDLGTGSIDYAPADWIVSNGTSWDKIDNSEGIGNNFVDTDHATVLAAISSSTLIPGVFYRISDHQTIHVIPETSDINTASVEPLICLALSTDKLSNLVWSEQFPGDIIEYDITDVSAEDNITPRKGKIFYRKDTVKNLETWYDFRNVKFRRWLLDGSGGNATWAPSTSYSQGQVIYDSSSGRFLKAFVNHTSDSSSLSTDIASYKWMKIFLPTDDKHLAWTPSLGAFGSGMVANSSSHADYLTFEVGSEDITISKSYTAYNNIVFLGYGHAFEFEANCTNITIGGMGSGYYIAPGGNTIGSNSSNIIFYASNSVHIGEYNAGLIISLCTNLTIQDNCYQLYLDSLVSAEIENQCNNICTTQSILFKIGSLSNFFILDNVSRITSETDCKNTVIGGSGFCSTGKGSTDNKILNSYFVNIGTHCHENVLSTTSNILIENGCYQNTVTNGYGNKIGMYNRGNTITNGNNNLISNEAPSNTITDSSCNFIGVNSFFNVIENGSTHVRIDGSAISNTINASNYIYIGNESFLNSILTGSNHIHIGNACGNNLIQDASMYTTLEDLASSNTIQGGSLYVTIGKNSHGNSISDTSSYATIGSGSTSNVIKEISTNVAIGDYSANNTIEGGSSFVKIGNYSIGNTFSASSTSNELGDLCGSNTFTASSNNLVSQMGIGNTFSNSSYNIVEISSSSNQFTDSTYNKVGPMGIVNIFSSSNSNILGGSCGDNTFNTGSTGNVLENYCSNNIFSLNSYSATINNVLGPGTNNCTITGSNNTLEANCSYIVCTDQMLIAQCYFSAGVNNITLDFNDGHSITALRIMLPNSTSYTFVEGKTGSPVTYNNKVFDMKDSGGDLWANTIDTSGVVATEKLISN